MATIAERYKKEQQRLKKFIARAKKRGYSFEENVIPKPVKRPTTKSIERLQKLTPEKLYDKAKYYDIITDKVVTGTEARKLERSRASKKAAQTRAAKKTASTTTVAGQPPNEADSVLRYAEELIANFQPLPQWKKSYVKLKNNDVIILNNILQGAINELGRRQVAKNIENNAGLFKELAFAIVYGSSNFKWTSVEGDIVGITAIIRGRALTLDEAKTVSLEAQESLDIEE